MSRLSKRINEKYSVILFINQILFNTLELLICVESIKYLQHKYTLGSNINKQINIIRSRVQFKILFMCSEKPIIMCSIQSLKKSLMLPLKWFQCLTNNDPLSSFQGRSSRASSWHTSPPGDQWRDVLGFVPTGSVSCSSTLKNFWGASYLWRLLSSQPIPWPRHGQGRTSTEFSKVDVKQWDTPVWDIPLSGASSMNLWGWWHEWSDCYLLRQSSGGNEWQLPPPLSGWWLRLCRLPYHYYGWWLHLAWQWSPTLSGLWWLSHQCTLWDSVVFLN